MAATWEVRVEVKNLARKEARVIAVREDLEADPSQRTYTIDSVLVDTSLRPLSEIRANIVQTLWAQHEARIAREGQIATLLSGWEAALGSDLAALEGS